jgi:hypothetical protein
VIVATTLTGTALADFFAIVISIFLIPQRSAQHVRDTASKRRALAGAPWRLLRQHH